MLPSVGTSVYFDEVQKSAPSLLELRKAIRLDRKVGSGEVRPERTVLGNPLLKLVIGIGGSGDMEFYLDKIGEDEVGKVSISEVSCPARAEAQLVGARFRGQRLRGFGCHVIQSAGSSGHKSTGVPQVKETAPHHVGQPSIQRPWRARREKLIDLFARKKQELLG